MSELFDEYLAVVTRVEAVPLLASTSAMMISPNIEGSSRILLKDYRPDKYIQLLGGSYFGGVAKKQA